RGRHLGRRPRGTLGHGLFPRRRNIVQGRETRVAGALAKLALNMQQTASRVPVDAAEGTAARLWTSLANVTSTSAVGLPRLTRISRPSTCVISPMGVIPSPQLLAAPQPQPAASSRCPHPYGR